jgi:hypothetical protein
VSGRPDLLALVYRILDARNAPAGAELREGLRLHVAEGESGLTAWLSRPIERAELTGDELDALREGLEFAVGVARKAERGGPQLQALTIVERLGKSISVVTARRPPALKPNEVQEAIRGEMDTCVEHLLRHTREAATKLERARLDFDAWARSAFGEHGGAEAVRRLNEMLETT